MFPKKVIDREQKPVVPIRKEFVGHSYRPSSVNVFPKLKTRPLFDPINSPPKSSAKPSTPRPGQLSVVAAKKALSPIENHLALFKPKPLGPKPILTASASIHNESNLQPALKPKPVYLSPRRQSLCLMSFDDTNVAGDENSFDDVDPDGDSSLNTACQFNDTIEAMDYFMGEGHKLLESAVKKPPTSSPSHQPLASPSSPNLMHFSPKIGGRTPDTIRRRLLMRNLLRNSDANQAGSDGYQFSHEEMMLRRSIRPVDDSFED